MIGFDILSVESVIKQYGKIDSRAESLTVPQVSLGLIYELHTHINEISQVFLINSFNLSKPFETYLKYEIYQGSLNHTLSEVFYQCKLVKEEDLKFYTPQALFIDEENTQVNWFYLLINFIKQNIFNRETNAFISTSYEDPVTHNTVSLSNLFSNVCSVIHNFDYGYINHFISFHFYGLFFDAIFNDRLKSDYVYDTKTNKFILSSEKTFILSDEEFSHLVKNYITDEELQKFKESNEINDFKSYHVDFIRYVSIINSILETYQKTSDDILYSKIPYNICQINYAHKFSKELCLDNNHIPRCELSVFDRLVGTDLHEGILTKIAKELTDYCLHISYVRENLKTIIQQYSYIGTKNIVTSAIKDFFLKNFSKRSEWRLQSELSLQKENNMLTSGLFRTLKELNEGVFNNEFGRAEQDAFSIDIVEYYDTTKYLNLEAELPMVVTGTATSGSYYTLSSWIDENFVAQSQEVEVPVEVDVFSPCAMFVKSYNSKFWQESVFTTTHEENSKYDDLIDFYSQYISDLNQVSTKAAKIEVIDNIITPLVNATWETFALSGLSENTENAELYNEYIGTENSVNRLQNIQNSVFPTIAPFVNLSGLVELSEYIEKDLLYVAKPFYENSIPRIKQSTKQIMRMHNKDGVGVNGWRKTYVLMHGYNTSYEHSENLTEFSPNPNKLIDIDGPWAYSALQDFIYSYYDKNIDEANDQKIDSWCNEFISKYYKIVDKRYYSQIKVQLKEYYQRIISENNETNFNIADFKGREVLKVNSPMLSCV